MKIFRIVIITDLGNVTHIYVAAHTNIGALWIYSDCMDLVDYDCLYDYIELVPESDYDKYRLYKDETETDTITIGEYLQTLESPDIIMEIFDIAEVENGN